ncbi:MAG: SPOR domain-containing protein [Candidatus Aminicenantales bacterium]
MRNKEFREIQVSSSALVFIFLAILVLGVFIFLLGVSVGKKQAQIAGPPTVLAQRTVESVIPEQPIPQADAEKTPPAGIVGTTPVETTQVESTRDPVREETPTPKPKVTEEPRPAARGGYSIQVGAFQEKSQASTLAARYRNQGYSAAVIDPLPTDRKTVYRVRLTGYPTKEKADQALAELNSSSGKKTGFFVVRD